MYVCMGIRVALKYHFLIFNACGWFSGSIPVKNKGGKFLLKNIDVWRSRIKVKIEILVAYFNIIKIVSDFPITL